MASKFQVIIVGGGVAGLLLANALEKAEVNYVLLEGKSEFAPAVGASIALGANGNRILDQLGCYEKLERKTEPIVDVRTWKDGKLLRVSDQAILNHKRNGYPFYFCDRHFLLATLYGNIKDKSHLFLNKRVSRIDHDHETATVQCKDGTSYTGNVVVGADGVFSIVREEMFRHMEVNEPNLLTSSDKTAISSEYRCMYGVSKPTMGLDSVGDTASFNQVLGHGLSFLHIKDKSGRIFWFVFEKMNETYQYLNMPRFSDEDSMALAKRAMSAEMNDKVTFADLWANRLAYKLVPLEEGLFKYWTWGRVVCIGDSVHKWTPNIGQGGNNAIESAALLANKLHRLARQTSHPSSKDVAEALQIFHKRRLPRAESTFQIANLVTRLETLKGPVEEFLALSVIPRVGDWLINQIALGTVGAEKLDFLPDPKRSYSGTMAFNQNYGPGTKLGLARRALLALPFLVLSYFANTIFSNILAQSALQKSVGQALTSGQIKYDGRTWDLPTLLHPFGLLVTAFSPSILNIDRLQRIQMTSFAIDLAPIWLIWILESHRRANEWKFTFTFPILYGMAFQMFGIGIVGPIWFFIHYVQSPLADYAAKDWRLVNVAAAKTVLLAIIVTFTIPTLAMYNLPDTTQRLTVNMVWQAFPVISIVFQYVLRKIFVTDTTKDDRIHNVEADMPYTRLAVWTLAGISALVFNVARFTSGVSLATLIFPDWTLLKSTALSGAGTLDLISGMRLFLQVDEIVVFSAAFLWLAYLINDIKEAEMTSISWISVIASAVAGTFIAGPGAVVVLGWWWRENILATKHAKGSAGHRD